jgi:hypothetical protein
VKATIALEKLSENGLCVDATQLARIGQLLEDQKATAQSKVSEGKFRAFFGLRNNTRKEMAMRRRVLSQLLTETMDVSLPSPSFLLSSIAGFLLTFVVPS